MQRKNDCIVLHSEITNEKGGQVVLIMRIEDFPVEDNMLSKLRCIMDSFSEQVKRSMREEVNCSQKLIFYRSLNFIH